jgi:hypothetical protein
MVKPLQFPSTPKPLVFNDTQKHAPQVRPVFEQSVDKKHIHDTLDWLCSTNPDLFRQHKSVAVDSLTKLCPFLIDRAVNWQHSCQKEVGELTMQVALLVNKAKASPHEQTVDGIIEAIKPKGMWSRVSAVLSGPSLFSHLDALKELDVTSAYASTIISEADVLISRAKRVKDRIILDTVICEHVAETFLPKDISDLDQQVVHNIRRSMLTSVKQSELSLASLESLKTSFTNALSTIRHIQHVSIPAYMSAL